MAKITQKDINDAVWKACDTFRGSIDPSVYKDYVLTMLFLKYLSDVHDDKMEGYLEKYKGDEERAKRAMQHRKNNVKWWNQAKLTALPAVETYLAALAEQKSLL